MKIAVVVDSGCGLSKEEVEEQGIYFLPLQIVDGDKTYLDGIDLSDDEVSNMIRRGIQLKTSLPSIGNINELFKKIKKDGYDHIIAVPLSSGLSSTMHALNMAAEEINIGISCIETWTTCYIQAYIALSAKKLVDKGLELKEILDKLNDSIDNSDTYIMPTDMNHLKRGGRLTPLAASMANLLKIKPILCLDKKSDGKIDTVSKVRTTSKALTSAVNEFKERTVINDDYLLIICATQECEDMVQQLKEEYFNYYSTCDTHIDKIGPVISVHTGLGCCGIQYIKKVL